MFKSSAFFLFFACLLIKGYGQQRCNTALIQQLHETASLTTPLDILVEFKPGREDALKNQGGVRVKYTAGNIASVTATKAAILKLAEQTDIRYMEYIRPNLRPMMDTALNKNRIAAVKAGMAPLTQPYDGTGVVVGFIDSGIDFNHPDFKDVNNNTRIKYIWDMTVATPTNMPSPFNYGQEWTNTDIDLGNCTENDLAYWGHGTHVSGITVGNGRAVNHFEGIAPKADIIMVSLDFNRGGPTIADAVQYIANKAQAMGKPFVINASVGDYYGSHDATDLQAQMIDALIANIPGRSMVAAAGNGGNIPFHLNCNPTAADTNFVWIQNANSHIYFWMFADTNTVSHVQYSMGVDNQSFHDLGRTPFHAYNYSLAGIKTDTIYHAGQRIGTVSSWSSINSAGVYELDFDIAPDSSNFFWRIETMGNGHLDAWSFDFVNSGLPSAAQYPRISKYVLTDTMQTICSGFQCSDEIITVASYINRNQYVDVNNNLQVNTDTPGAIAATSSVGPTRRHQQKPDVSASGATSISCGVLSMLPGIISSSPQAVAQGGYHVVGGGTSEASPMVAGVAALYLQRYPSATNQQIKQAITNCAYTDVFTTAAVPDYRWGYGKLDGYHAFTCSITTGMPSYAAENGITVYPNPARTLVNIRFDKPGSRTVILYNMLGNQVRSMTATEQETTLNIDGLSKGVYLAEIREGGKAIRQKIMVE